MSLNPTPPHESVGSKSKIPWQEAFIPSLETGRPTGDLSYVFLEKLDASMKNAFEFSDYQNYPVRKYFTTYFEAALASALINRALEKEGGIVTVKSAVKWDSEHAIAGDEEKQFVIDLMTNSNSKAISQPGDLVVQVLLGDSPLMDSDTEGVVLERVDGVVASRMMRSGVVRVHGIIQSPGENRARKDGDETNSVLFRINSRGMDIFTPLDPHLEEGVLENSKYAGMQLYVKTHYSSYWIDGQQTDEMIPATISVVAFSPEKENKTGLIHHGRRFSRLLFSPTTGRLGLGKELPVCNQVEIDDTTIEDGQHVSEFRILDLFELNQDTLMKDGVDTAVLSVVRFASRLAKVDPSTIHLKSEIQRNMTITTPSLELKTLRFGLPQLLNRIMNRNHLGEKFSLSDAEVIGLRSLVLALVPQIHVWDQGDSYSQ